MTGTSTLRAGRFGCFALGFALLLPARGAAAQSCSASPAAGATARAEPWGAPLDRKVTLRARNLTLRDALDRVAAAAHLRFSYADELLPLDREVCTSFKDAPLGDVLTSLLSGARVTPVAAGRDQVILAPAAVGVGVADVPAPYDVVTLDRIVVTGSASGAPQRELPVALSVLGRRELESANTGTMSQLLDAGVPGLWLWEQSPATVVASYGSVRGASSFGLTTPKVYLDGIQVANPLLFSQLAPNAVERIEVTRGPQGTALYGADALSGVINIVTRREHLEPGTPRARMQSSLGMTQSSFAGGTTTQLHALSLRGGSDLRSGGLDVAVGSIGAYMPGAYNRHVTATGGARLVGARTILTTTGRFFAQRAGVALSPVLRDALGGSFPLDSALAVRPAEPQNVREYTLGGTLTYAPESRWTHSAVLGLDGYDLSGVVLELTPRPSAADSALNAARGSADRGTLRLSSVGRFGDGGRVSGSLTFAAEQSVLRERTAGGNALTLVRAPSDSLAAVTHWQRTTAAVSQGQLSIDNTLFLTGGLRAESTDGLAAPQSAVLPMLGFSLARDYGPVTVKLRSAYGRGIRPAQVPARETMWAGMRAQLESASLEPERQQGIEAGLDLVYRGNLALHLTRYDQVASGLIQQVCWPAPDRPDPTQDGGAGGGMGPHGNSGPGDGRDYYPRLEYGLQNVGSITNHGWELQSTGRVGALALAGTLTYTDSRVQSVAGRYTGDLLPSDRVLGIPAWTGSLTSSWSNGPWAASFSGYRAYDWIDYDRVALTRDFQSGTHSAYDLSGARLRNYWRRYTGLTHLRASFTRELPKGLTLQVAGDNLLNRQVGEPDNITVLPGRSVTLGLRAAF